MIVVEGRWWASEDSDAHEFNEEFPTLQPAFKYAATTFAAHGRYCEFRVYDHGTDIEAVWFDSDNDAHPWVFYGSEGYGAAWGMAMDAAFASS